MKFFQTFLLIALTGLSACVAVDDPHRPGHKSWTISEQQLCRSTTSPSGMDCLSITVVNNTTSLHLDMMYRGQVVGEFNEQGQFVPIVISPNGGSFSKLFLPYQNEPFIIRAKDEAGDFVGSYPTIIDSGRGSYSGGYYNNYGSRKTYVFDVSECGGGYGGYRNERKVCVHPITRGY